jgi:hypothetical protein
MLSVGRAIVMGGMVMGCLGGCASVPDPGNWIVAEHVDEFTDARTCRVEQRARGSSLRQVMSFVPYAERRGEELRVGLRSATRYGGLPTGDVRLRVDENPAWTISTAETPIDARPAGEEAWSKALPANATDTDRVQFEATTREAMGTIGKMISPYTAATGEKAAAMLAQMKSGTVLIYETSAFNQPGSSTGRVALDAQFKSALAACGL